jgi:hypothetical protein
MLGVLGCGGGGRDARTDSGRTPPAASRPGPSSAATPPATTGPARRGSGLAIGLTESNASLVRAPGTRPYDAAFAPWQARVSALRPQLFRVPIDWATLQPSPDRPAALDGMVDGCMRTQAPCAPYEGLRALFAALRSQQRHGPGFAAMVVFYGVPDWAAATPSGCERPGLQARSRPITARGLRAFRALVRQVARLARAEHLALRWWSPWNEPNGAYFITPQRAHCSADSPPLSADVYTQLFDAVAAELRRLPGRHELVLGDLAGIAVGTPRSTGSGEFIRALPDHVVCAAAVAAQHAYADLPGQKTLPGDPVASTLAALHDRPCARDTPVWITETGVGGIHAGERRPTGRISLIRQCQTLQRQLRAWRRDPRIEAAFQYTFREDQLFPVGLADAGLTRVYPTYDLLKAWASRPHVDDPAPPLPASCRR